MHTNRRLGRSNGRLLERLGTVRLGQLFSLLSSVLVGVLGVLSSCRSWELRLSLFFAKQSVQVRSVFATSIVHMTGKNIVDNPSSQT